MELTHGNRLAHFNLLGKQAVLRRAGISPMTLENSKIEELVRRKMIEH
jgi:hypothetical protein